MTEPNEAIKSTQCEDSEVLLFGQHTSLVQKLKKDLQDSLKDLAPSIIGTLASKQGNQSVRIIIDRRDLDKEWFEEGKDCEILRLGAKDWEPGKVRIKFTLEFCPDEPEDEEEEEIEADEMKQLEDSLDDLRQKLNPDN